MASTGSAIDGDGLEKVVGSASWGVDNSRAGGEGRSINGEDFEPSTASAFSSTGPGLVWSIPSLFRSDDISTPFRSELSRYLDENLYTK